jgi:hypothetical protein
MSYSGVGSFCQNSNGHPAWVFFPNKIITYLRCDLWALKRAAPGPNGGPRADIIYIYATTCRIDVIGRH